MARRPEVSPCFCISRFCSCHVNKKVKKFHISKIRYVETVEKAHLMSQTTIDRDQPKKPAVRQKRAQERIELILSVTNDLVLSEGTQEVTTTLVAHQAEVPVGSVYKYFGDKTDLLFVLYQRVFANVIQELKETLRSVPSNTGFVEIVDRLFDQFIESCETHESYVPLTRWANGYRPELRASDLDGDEIGEIFREALDKAKVKLPSKRQEFILQTLVSLTSALVDQAFDSDDEEWREGLINELRIVQRAYIEAVGTTS